MKSIGINELRVGNMLIDTFGRHVVVSEIKKVGVRCEYDGEQNTDKHGRRISLFQYDDLSGIPITPEMLHEAGLEKDNHPPANVWSDGSIIIFYKKDALIDGFYTTYWKSAIVFKYWHQLQNFYFSITDKELSIPPPINK